MEKHTVTIENRELTEISDVKEIDSFDEDEIRATLNNGAIIIKGNKLNIQRLDLDEGEVVISGRVDSLMYVKVKEKGEKGFIAKIIK